VRRGEIPESRIDESVLKILRAKAEVGLNLATLVDIDAVSHRVATPQSLELAQETADEAVTLVRDNHAVLPLKATAQGTNSPQNAYHSTAENRARTLLLIFTPDVRGDAGWVLERQVRARISDVRTIYVEPRNVAAWNGPAMEAVSQAQTVIAAVYLSPQGGAPANMAALSSGPEGLLQNVIESAAAKTIVLAMGNPYIASQIPKVQNYLCTFSDAEVSESSAAKALFGEIPTPGRLPVTIPGIAARGAGMSMSSGGTQ
jgi:beta-N-acetylhexosaminidase